MHIAAYTDQCKRPPPCGSALTWKKKEFGWVQKLQPLESPVQGAALHWQIFHFLVSPSN